MAAVRTRTARSVRWLARGTVRISQNPRAVSRSHATVGMINSVQGWDG